MQKREPRNPAGDASDDGHPCEAALEFRRQLMIRGLAEEVPADLLDLCIAIAWIGKAVSRTEEAQSFLDTGIDPNTWQVVGAAGGSRDFASRLIEISASARGGHGMAAELAGIRMTESFKSALTTLTAAVEDTQGRTPQGRRWDRLRPFAVKLIKAPKPPEALEGNVVAFERFRGRTETSRT